MLLETSRQKYLKRLVGRCLKNGYIGQSSILRYRFCVLEIALDFPGYAGFPSVDGEIRPKANIVFDQLKEEGLIRTDAAGGPFFNLTEKGLLEGNTTWLKRKFERLNDKQGIWAFLSFLVSLIALFSKR